MNSLVRPKILAPVHPLERDDLVEQAQAVAHVGVWISGIAPTDSVEWSAECYRIFGVAFDTPMSVESFFSKIHPDDRERVKAASVRAIERDVPYDVEHRIVRDDGSIRWVVEKAKVVRDERGHALRMVGVVQDVTDRVEALERATASERKYRRILEATSDGVWMTDASLITTFVNRRMADMLGCAVADIIGRSPLEFIANPPEDAATRLARSKRSEPGELELELQRRDGTSFWARVGVARMLDAQGAYAGTIAMVSDLTERRAAELALRQAQKLEAIGSLAGGIAHDFNNLMSVVLMYSSSLGARLAPDEPMAAEVREIRLAGERAAALTRQLLAFSRRQVLQPRTIDMNELIDDMEQMLRRVLGEDVELELAKGDELACVHVDPNQLQHVVMNLVINARDAMPHGGRLTIETANVELEGAFAKQHELAPGAYVMLSVSDTGEGMDAVTRAHIFEPFFTTKTHGTGLGLSTVFGIVKQSGGNVTAFSEPGRGTSLKIHLPSAPEKPLQAHAAPSTPPPSLDGHETILVVEDDASVRGVASKILRQHGYTVLEAGGPGDALLLAEQHRGPIHLVLSDIIMPRMRGPELVSRLRPSRPDLRVLYMSGYADGDTARRREQVMSKPLTPRELLRSVRAVLDA